MQAEDSGDDAVYGVGNEEDDSFDDGEEYEAEALSDLEGAKNDDDDLPNIRAWGKEKKNFYSTNYVDKDFGGFQGKDAEMAEMEEKEAETLQQQLLQRMQDEDFSIPPSGKRSTDERKSTQSKKLKRGTIVTDESNILLKMIKDNEEKMKTREKYLEPVLEQFRNGKLAYSKAVQFVDAQNQLILNYSTNVHYSLHLEASQVDVEKHPVMNRLMHYHNVLSHMDPFFESIIKPQINKLLDKEGDREQTIIEPSKKKKKEKKKMEKGHIKNSDDSCRAPSDYHEKRPITHEMAKNKGLTPHKKKDARNPRIVLRKKHRKAVIRRKGAIRAPRTESVRYSGEPTGIKISVAKSIKI